MGSRYTALEAQQLVERFLSRKTLEPIDLVKLPYALGFLVVCHLETIAGAVVDLSRMKLEAPTPATPNLALYACGECGTLTRGPVDAPHSLACAEPTCSGIAHPLPGKKAS